MTRFLEDVTFIKNNGDLQVLPVEPEVKLNRTSYTILVHFWVLHQIVGQIYVKYPKSCFFVLR